MALLSSPHIMHTGLDSSRRTQIFDICFCIEMRRMGDAMQSASGKVCLCNITLKCHIGLKDQNVLHKHGLVARIKSNLV